MACGEIRQSIFNMDQEWSEGLHLVLMATNPSKRLFAFQDPAQNNSTKYCLLYIIV
jgi:hypothetical protein